MDVGFRVAATSLDDIAAEVGVTRVILYRHFDSKTDLYQAVLDRFRGVLGAPWMTVPFAPVAGSNPTSDFETALRDSAVPRPAPS